MTQTFLDVLRYGQAFTVVPSGEPDPDSTDAVRVLPRAESFTFRIPRSQVRPAFIDAMFGYFPPDEDEPPFPDPEDHLEDDPRV